LFRLKAKALRKEWYEKRLGWTVEKWRKVNFSNKFSIAAGRKSVIVFIARKPGEECKEDCLVPKFTSYLLLWFGVLFEQDRDLSLLFGIRTEGVSIQLPTASKPGRRARGIHNEPLADGGQDSGVYVSRHDLLRSHAMNEEIKKKTYCI